MILDSFPRYFQADYYPGSSLFQPSIHEVGGDPGRYSHFVNDGTLRR